jgi:hypothetical protein
MGVPQKDTVWGNIKIDNNTYDILNRPISEKIRFKINNYKKLNNGLLSSTPWQNDKYMWSIDDNKLYLTTIDIKYLDNDDNTLKTIPNIKRKNIIRELFNNEEVYASWYSGNIRIILKKDIKKIDAQMAKVEVTMTLKVLKIKKGKVISSNEEIQKFIKIDIWSYID